MLVVWDETIGTHWEYGTRILVLIEAPAVCQPCRSVTQATQAPLLGCTTLYAVLVPELAEALLRNGRFPKAEWTTGHYVPQLRHLDRFHTQSRVERNESATVLYQPTFVCPLVYAFA